MFARLAGTLLIPAACAGCMATAAPPEDSSRYSSPAERYVGTKRWVDAKSAVSLCKAPLDSSAEGPRPTCSPLPPGTELTIDEVVYKTTSLGIKMDIGLRVTTSKGETGYIRTTDAIMMMDQSRHAKKQAEKADCDRRGGAKIGMTKDQVYASCWGRPDKVNETITRGGRHEQWVYGGGYIYVDNGIVTSIQTSR